jgi:predicted amidohydrolase YtcJ
MQPYHAIDDGRWAANRLDTARLRGTYAFRSLLATRAHLAFGSDWTVAPLDPIQGIYAAVTRRTLDGLNPDGWFPEQKLSLDEALRAYTAGVAYAGFLDDKVGVLRPGMLADLALLDRDLFRERPEDIAQAHVVATVVGGRVVYERR